VPRPERAFRTQAIILKRRDLGEADRLLTVLTPRHGKIEVIAKGARKATSTKTGHVELFTRADMLIHKGRELGIAVQAEMVESFLGLREDLKRGAYANYTVELLDRFTGITEDEDASELFSLLNETLERLAVDDDPRLVVRYYEMRMLDLVGYRPELLECVVERDPVLPEDQFFSFAQGGVVCKQHAHMSSTIVPVSVLTLKLMRHMQRSSYRQVKSLQVSPELHRDVERVMLGYITFILERKLQSVEFLRLILL
jgi:DNA repair protein RecO (recombination protein O)